MITHLNLHTFT